MKKLAIVLSVTVTFLCMVSSAFAGSIKPGEMAKCTNAKSITLENTGGGGPSEFGSDRNEANASIWKSSNFTTVPISLSPNANNGLTAFEGGAAGNKKVHMPSKHSMGHKSITLTGQTNFSRGDSIGDISGEVRITNTGTTGLNVTCG
jgi:hypothetical protein